MKRTIATIVTAAAAVAAFVAPASAHVTAQPPQQPAGGYTVVNFRVPVEKDSNTTKLEVQFPDGILSASTKPVPGWTATVKKEKLDTPVDDGHGGKATEQVDTVTWTGGEIKPGEFQEFPVSVKLPAEGELGDALFFPALQTYADGEVVEWTQKPASADDTAELEHPAPKVTLEAGGDDHHAAASDDKADESSSDDSASKADDDDESGISPNVAFGVGIVALVLSLIAFARGGRRRG
jgi:uncharacterized protein